jgi:hypothetical protein
MPAPFNLVNLWFFGRMFLAGIAGGVLCVLFYALADDRREPFVRQAIGYPLRRHTYAYPPKEDMHAHSTSSDHVTRGG